MNDAEQRPRIEREVRAAMADYADGNLGDEQLVDRLGCILEDGSGGATGDFASELSGLVSRVEMICLNICAAERRGAITQVLAEFEGRHFA